MPYKYFFIFYLLQKQVLKIVCLLIPVRSFKFFRNVIMNLIAVT